MLSACEFSGIVRDAFENAGWYAWSCDLLPTESEQTQRAGKHIQGDVLSVINDDWDLIVGFPPCTYLSYAYTGANRYSIGRLQNKIDALQFFLNLWAAPAKHICLENPLGYVSQGLLPHSQIIEPYYFGHNYKKRTCLWLKNLPLLQYRISDDLFGKKTAVKPMFLYHSGNNSSKLPIIGKPFGGKERSRFHTGIAAAMAEQWTDYIINQKAK